MEALKKFLTTSPVHKPPCRAIADQPAEDLLLPLFVSAFCSFWPPKAAADCQTISFLASFYKIRLGKNHSKST
jgi:hypothetical protein